jgi:hypothetical protein
MDEPGNGVDAGGQATLRVLIVNWHARFKYLPRLVEEARNVWGTRYLRRGRLVAPGTRPDPAESAHLVGTYRNLFPAAFETTGLTVDEHAVNCRQHLVWTGSLHR